MPVDRLDNGSVIRRFKLMLGDEHTVRCELTLSALRQGERPPAYGRRREAQGHRHDIDAHRLSQVIGSDLCAASVSRSELTVEENSVHIRSGDHKKNQRVDAVEVASPRSKNRDSQLTPGQEGRSLGR
ncbi:MAG TPA: hypothetical protein VIO94_11715 [Phenylobacterium sp.]